jgi:hypothetical protein
MSGSARLTMLSVSLQMVTSEMVYSGCRSCTELLKVEASFFIMGDLYSIGTYANNQIKLSKDRIKHQ